MTAVVAESYSTTPSNLGRVFSVRTRAMNDQKNISWIRSVWKKLLAGRRRSTQVTNTQRATLFNNANNVTIGNSTFVMNVGCQIANPISGILLVDAAGKEYRVSMDFAISLETFTKAISLLLESNAMEARIQRSFVNEGLYELSVDQGTQIVSVNDQSGWASQIQPGTKVVMSAVVPAWAWSKRQYECPRCKTWNTPNINHRSSTDCEGCYGRFQISEVNLETTWHQLESKRKTAVRDETNLKMLRNFLVKQHVLPLQASEIESCLDLLRDQLPDKPEIPHHLMTLIKEYKRGAFRPLDVIERVVHLFHSHPELMPGLHEFSPEECNFFKGDSIIFESCT
ncbi:hypothetical protein CPB83DRAFT_856037 [Crepidotus variabilis]|uniref:Ubiquitin-like domain-containing protein n=1 Tax=Crepidotus variabilis TaxID=179855 RepID=A0A9P6EDR8_9AGAR|nr:hypothetical protein CPB83DRAFT_856037 [Crepidotus variabilis]